jgi:hypothetical protein
MPRLKSLRELSRVDTICIDKTSSAELSEAVKSVCVCGTKDRKYATHLSTTMSLPDTTLFAPITLNKTLRMFRVATMSPWIVPVQFIRTVHPMKVRQMIMIVILIVLKRLERAIKTTHCILYLPGILTVDMLEPI